MPLLVLTMSLKCRFLKSDYSARYHIVNITHRTINLVACFALLRSTFFDDGERKANIVLSGENFSDWTDGRSFNLRQAIRAHSAHIQSFFESQLVV